MAERTVEAASGEELSAFLVRVWSMGDEGIMAVHNGRRFWFGTSFVDSALRTFSEGAAYGVASVAPKSRSERDEIALRFAVALVPAEAAARDGKINADKVMAGAFALADVFLAARVAS